MPTIPQTPAAPCSPDAVNPACGLPARPQSTVTVTDFPVCPESTCDTAIPLPAPAMPACPPCVGSPCSAPEADPHDCCWADEAIRSVPPAIPCAPVNVGYGAWDAGFKWWTGLNPDYPDVITCCQDYISRVYGQFNWHHVLDLNTNAQHHSILNVRRDGTMQNINEMEFLTLAVRMAQLAALVGAVPPPMTPALMGLTVAPNGADSNGKSTYALVNTYAGQPVGTALPLSTMRDASGDLIGLALNPAGLA